MRLFITLITVGSLFSGLQAQSNLKNNLYIKFGYFTPAKESYRTNYDQSFFISDNKFPLSFGVGISIPYSDKFFFNFEINKIQNGLTSSDKFHLNQIPLSIGGKYYLSSLFYGSLIKPYIGASFNFYWSYFSSWYIKVDENGGELGVADETDHYFGYGIAFHLGTPIFRSNRFYSGFEITYDLNHHGVVQKGGLGNIGGFLFGLTFGLDL
jgi:hypothetical protein